MIRTVWSTLSLRDLQRISDFYEKFDPELAIKVLSFIQHAVQLPRIFPLAGRKIPKMENVYEIVTGEFIVRYEFTPEKVAILRVWHGKEKK